MATVKKIKKAQGGLRQALGQVKCFKGSCGPVREKGPGLVQRIRQGIEDRKTRKEMEKDQRAGYGRGESYERDFPGDVAPGGFGGGEGLKSTRWSDKDNKTKYVAGSGNMKKGGKITKADVLVGRGVIKAKKGGMVKAKAKAGCKACWGTKMKSK